jgi:hypothetical protein
VRVDATDLTFKRSIVANALVKPGQSGRVKAIAVRGQPDTQTKARREVALCRAASGLRRGRPIAGSGGN